MLTKTGISLKRCFLNPIVLSIFLGCGFGILALPLPALLKTVVSQSSACASVVSMMLTGLVISTFSFKELLLDKKAYVFVALRLIALPLIVGLAFLAFQMKSVLPLAVLFTCLPCGLNPIVFAKLVGEDCRYSASIVLISHLLCIATIPFWLTVFL